MAEFNEHVDQAVADGRIDAEQAAEMKAGALERVTGMVNGTLPARGGHHHGRGDDADPSTDTTAPATAD